MDASKLTKPFWAACREGRLIRQVCDVCQCSFFTPQLACPRCHSEKWTWKESSGNGIIYSKSVVSRSPRPEIATPYVAAIVLLDEDWFMLSNIVNCAPADPEFDMRVRVVFQREWEGEVLPEFELVKQSTLAAVEGRR